MSAEEEAEIVRLSRELEQACAERDAAIDALSRTPLDGMKGTALIRRVAVVGAQRRWIAALQQRDRYRSAWLSARRGRNLWRALYCGAVTGRKGEMNVVSRDLYQKHVVTVARENRRARNRIEKLENDLADLRLAFSEYQGAQVRPRPFGLTGCQSTTHCANWGFCHRCQPELTAEAGRLFKDTDGSSDAYTAIIWKLTGRE